MPKAMEEALKKKFGQNSKIPFKIMNAKGFMHGNKETEKGRESDAKHEKKESKKVDTSKMTSKFMKMKG